MRINGQDFNGIGDVFIIYDSGPATLLQNHPHLAYRVALLGTPTRIQCVSNTRFSAEWDLPTGSEFQTFGNPWPLDRRAAIRLRVTRAATNAVLHWLGRLHREADQRRIAAVLEIESVQGARERMGLN